MKMVRFIPVNSNKDKKYPPIYINIQYIERINTYGGRTDLTEVHYRGGYVLLSGSVDEIAEQIYDSKKNCLNK